MSHIEKIKQAGVVGAGGAGFPTHVKLEAVAEVIIANGAECEPLLRVDRQIMEFDAAKVVEGMRLAMETAKAPRGVICLKAKYKQAAASLEQVLAEVQEDITLKCLDNYYPSGDEQALVYEVTGRVVPTGGIPIAAGAVVLNVSTLVNVAKAVAGVPLTHKYVTITGEVKRPVTVEVPIGTSIKKLIEYAEGPKREDGYEAILGGPAMGTVAEDWETPVTKTLGGIIILPKAHSLLQRKLAPLEYQIKLARSVCCQCNQCTMLCPRRTLGLGTAPHLAMRALAYGNGELIAPEAVVSCCECGVCSYFACTMGLAPGRVMARLKGELLGKKVPFEKTESIGVLAEREFKNLPVGRLISRLGLRDYDCPAPMERKALNVQRVKIPLKQHIGAPSLPCVQVGQKVAFGEQIGQIPDKTLGANVHASIAGRVLSIDAGCIVIEGEGG